MTIPYVEVDLVRTSVLLQDDQRMTTTPLTPARARSLASQLTSAADEVEGVTIRVGTPVRRKDSEYLFQGIVVAVFPKLNGAIRLVVEGTQEGNKGMLHVMSEKNLEVMP